SQKLVEIIQSLLVGRGSRKDLGTIGELADTMGTTSICGLGQVASNPITSVIKHFPEDLDSYLDGRSQPSPLKTLLNISMAGFRLPTGLDRKGGAADRISTSPDRKGGAAAP